jgi:hypothetical protein
MSDLHAAVPVMPTQQVLMLGNTTIRAIKM